MDEGLRRELLARMDTDQEARKRLERYGWVAWGKTPEARADLTDRVYLAEGRPQVYGTQVELRGGHPQPCHLEDPDGVDERRAEVGLEPIARYLAGFSEDLG